MKLKIALLATAAFIFSMGSAQAYDATASVNILAPAQVATVTHLNFGDVIPGAAAGVRSNAAATVTGVAGSIVNLTVDPNVTLSDGDAATTDIIANLNSPQGEKTLPAEGQYTYPIDAVLPAIPANQAEGSYTGTYQVTASYQ